VNNLPAELILSLRNLESFDEEAFKAVHHSGGQITSIRLNPEKFIPPAAGQNLKFKIDESIPWSSNGYYLPERPSFTSDPLFHAGAYYVQEASSMFLEEVLKQTVDLSMPLKILDLCAAPGGKSTLIHSLITKDSLLVSNEVIRTRANILSENITKWGTANVVVTNNDPKDFQRLENYFDVIVVDAPCSGSGLFRKDPTAVDEWSEQNVELCAQRQQRILADIMPSLNEGGILIYSTCSYSQQEDEEIGDWLLEQFAVDSLQLAVDEHPGIVETISEKKKTYGYRFYPDKVKGEGFFIAAFKKKVAGERAIEVKNKKSKGKKSTGMISAKDVEILKPWLISPEDLIFIKQNEEIIAMPLTLENDLAIIQSSLYIKKAGVKLGTLIRDELIPAHELAVSCIISPSVNRYETDKETALQYLRKEEIKIAAADKGWMLVTYQQLPLGWIKVVSNRINNYYPVAWRILNK
jgi:16S rRNA C967 or C1407 C5-methylase (RsmB/RsmF family)/NOL1/NOP2/fmu family ribosome biogenesis protein